MYLVLLAIGLGALWFGWKALDEVTQIAAIFMGGLSVVWGVAIAPLPLQLGIEGLGIWAAFSLCMRGNRTSLKRLPIRSRRN